MKQIPTPILGDSAPTDGVALLENALYACQEQARNSIAFAEGVNRQATDFYRVTTMAYDRALAFLEASAKVGMALAKMKGEHTSNIRITRRDETAAPPPARPRREPPKFVSRPADPETAKRSQQIYDDWLAKKQVLDAQQAEGTDDDEDQDAWEDDREEGDPPDKFGGSNTSEP